MYFVVNYFCALIFYQLDRCPLCKRYDCKGVCVLMMLVESVIRRLQNSLCLKGRIHRRTHGCKWNLLKVRKVKYKREHSEAQVESGG
jgi:hypothetical protein